MKKFINIAAAVLVSMCWLHQTAIGSSHREAPLISNDPLADNTDLYAFKSPTDAEKIILIANYIPFEHPAGGPNWYSFGTNIRYEIHIDNNAATTGDDIIYRFAIGSERHPGFGQPQARGVGRAAGGVEHAVGVERVTVAQRDPQALALARDPGDIGLRAQIHALLSHLGGEEVAHVVVEAAQHLIAAVKLRDLRAQAAKDRCELARDVAAAHHHQVKRATAVSTPTE